MDDIKVGILMGSDSDLPKMKKAAEVLDSFGVRYFMTVASAHRTPERVIEIAKRAEREGWKVLIAGAGMAAHLAGFLAAHTVVQIVGIPMDTSPLGGIDALLSTVQMPGGVPVACMGLGASGAKNAGLFAVEMLACFDKDLRQKLNDYRREQKNLIEKKAEAMENQH